MVAAWGGKEEPNRTTLARFQGSSLGSGPRTGVSLHGVRPVVLGQFACTGRDEDLRITRFPVRGLFIWENKD